MEAEVASPEGAGGSSSVLPKSLPLVSLSQFLQLGQNADLNLPPPNWLRRRTAAGQHFQHSLFAQFDQRPSCKSQPSSIALASHYTEQLGDVDIVADAKNIKKLLMTPYSDSHVSMVVHRVGKTLLLDEFSLAMLSLKSFNFQKLLSDENIPELLTKKKHPASIHHRNMYSKLLYYSVEDRPMIQSQEFNPPALTAAGEVDTPTLQGDGHNTKTAPSCDKVVADSIETSPVCRNRLQATPTLDDAGVGDAICNVIAGSDVDVAGDGSSSGGKAVTSEESVGKEEFPFVPSTPPPQPFHLNVEWSIRDIRMLLGSDLPLFGKAGHPAISLRLRDMQKPITVLTGLDYWLDNLMCNVPELAMCFHLNGIVQKYEIIKTEDIPTLHENCQFSPQEVLEVAQNILAFLKANCTMEGHTYWLFRRRGEDIVKLYDLTSLNCFENGANPFAVSVAMLFYRVSKRMMADQRHTSNDLGMIKLLLENCISLLKPTDPSSQLVVSSYYLLADLVLNCSPCSSPSSSPCSSPTSSDCEREGERTAHEASSSLSMVAGTGSSTISVSELREGGFPVDTRPPVQPLILGCPQDRARTALEYITSGLAGSCQTDAETHQEVGTAQLLLKAAQAYWVLADAAMPLNRFGRALRYCRLCILCCKAATCSAHKSYPPDEKALGEVLFAAWQLCGDIHCLSTKVSESFQSHLEDFQLANPDDSHVLKVATTLWQPSLEEEGCLSLYTDLETSLQKSIDCYWYCKKVQLDSSDKEKKLQERMGNTLNEIGVYYMHVAKTLDYKKNSHQVEKLWQSSHHCLTTGLGHFEAVGNRPNQALLYANLGSLMRSCAEVYRSSLSQQTEELDDGGEFSAQEKLYFNRAVDYYQKGKEALRRLSTHAGIWLSLEADLSSLYLAMGSLLQEHPPLSSLSVPEVEREVIMVLMKALHNAESAMSHIDSNHSRFASFSKLIGDCHGRLGSLYQKIGFSELSSSLRKKQAQTQAERHYTKSLLSYLPSLHRREMLRVYLEKSLLFEQQAQEKSPQKFLHNALDCLLESRKVLEGTEAAQGMEGTKAAPGVEGMEAAQDENSEMESQLVKILLHRLLSVLKQMLGNSVKRNDPSHTQLLYKNMYRQALKCSASIGTGPAAPNPIVAAALESIAALLNE